MAGGTRSRRCLSTAALVAGVAVVAPVVSVTVVSGGRGSGSVVAVARPAGRAILATAADPEAATIRALQAQVVGAAYQAGINAAGDVLAAAEEALNGDRSALTRYEDEAQAAQADLTYVTEREAADQRALTAATAAYQAAERQLAADRQRLEALAISFYTGGADPLPPPGALSATEYAQDVLFSQTEAAEASTVIVGNVKEDVVAADADQASFDRLTATVAADRSEVANDTQVASSAAAAAGATEANLAGVEATVEARQAGLAAAQAAQRQAVDSVVGGSSSGVSIMGPAALDASQLDGWFTSSGYLAETSAGVSQLVSWYEEYGSEEGVRGDVAFAQAVLETGGFSSPDAVNLNNYAGIGHCDTCSSGFGFPSPAGGVLGQLQLLRAFADYANPAGPTAPVIPQVDPAEQSELGCCGTWESLTGVWATDPTYGAQILSIYQSMLDYALSG